uniref:F-box domain-containing protein n=1 Tax=Elaeophora elaphi TaxID=1147741 RepID=A0A0R3RMY9_9BILA
MDAITESPGKYWPVSRKYDQLNGRARACRLQDFYPIIQLDSTSYTSFRRTSKETPVTINDLSDDILLIIFGYFHPIDLIHCFSLVSHRWNYLANHPSFFTEVRVLVNDISLKNGSVKGFFHRTSQHLRKLCIDCFVRLPSVAFNALFDIYFPNVVHLDLGSFKEINATLLRKLSDSFPNVETLHMDDVERYSVNNQYGEEWDEVLEMLFENENIFPKMRNFFMGDVGKFHQGRKLLSCSRPLNLLRVYNGLSELDFMRIVTSLKSTLTELYLGYYIKNEDFQYIGDLHNLKVFSLSICLYTFDADIAPLKNLYNLEELRINCGGQDCDLTNDGMIALFTLSRKEPEKLFPYKLKHLEIADFHACKVNLLQVINCNCPELKTLGLQYNGYMGDEAVPFIISNFK